LASNNRNNVVPSSFTERNNKHIGFGQQQQQTPLVNNANFYHTPQKYNNLMPQLQQNPNSFNPHQPTSNQFNNNNETSFLKKDNTTNFEI